MSDDPLYEALLPMVDLAPITGLAAEDPVNAPMIRHWCDALGDLNPIYMDATAAEASGHDGIVAPPTMLQVWNMRGLSGPRRPAPEMDAQARMVEVLDTAGFSSVVATNCEQEYTRYLRPGDVLTETSQVESVSPRKRTALGEGYFLTTVRTYRDQAGQVVGTMRFRILKFKPAASSAPEPEVKPARPPVNRDTAFFWEGTRQGQLRIQRCTGCGSLRHPPSPGCGACGSLDWDWKVASGDGTVYSWVVHHHPPVTGHTPPFVIVLVELDEGVRMVGNLLEVNGSADPFPVHQGTPVRVDLVPLDEEIVLPQWRLR